MVDSLYVQVARGAKWLSSAVVVTTLVRLGSLAVLARILTPEDFGTVAVAVLVVGFLDVVLLRGLEAALVQMPEFRRRQQNTAQSLAIALATIAALATLLVAPYASDWLRLGEAGQPIRVLALIFPLRALSVVPRVHLLRNLEFDHLAKCRVGAAVVSQGVVATTAAAFGLGLWSLVLSHLASVLVLASAMWLKHGVRVPRVFDRTDGIAMLKLGSLFAVGEAGFFVSQRLDDVGVARTLGASSLGVYTNAYRLAAEPGDRLAGTVQTIFFPALSRLNTGSESFAIAYVSGVGALALVSFPVSIVLIIVADEVVQIALGAQWSAVVMPLRVLSASIGLRTTFKISEAVVQASGAAYGRAWRQWVNAFLVLLAVAVGRSWGVTGIAAGVTLAMSLSAVMMTSLGLRVAGGSWSLLLRELQGPFRTAVVVGPITLGTAMTLRTIGANTALVLGVTSAAALLSAVVLVYTAPRIFGTRGLNKLGRALRRSNSEDGQSP